MKPLSIFLLTSLLALTNAISTQVLSAQSASDIQIPPELAKMLPPGMTFAPDTSPVIFDEYNTVDDCQKEILYYYVKEDPVSEIISDEITILQIGRKASKFQSYNKYLYDSIAYVHTLNDIPITRDELQNKCRKTSGGSSDHLYRWHEKADSLTFFGRVGTNFYYDEPEPAFNWVLTDQTKQIGPYLCYKATSPLYGRIWEAWYTEDIPISEGPWKLAGLPGLIVMANDSESQHVFKLTNIRDANIPIVKNALSKPIKTQRVKFNKKQREHLAKPLKVYDGTDMMPTDLDGKPMQTPAIKRFTNIIEID